MKEIHVSENLVETHSKLLENLEQILDNRAGFGKHQLIVFTLLALIRVLLVGLDLYLKIFLNKLLFDEFHYTQEEVVITNTLMFVGILSGGLLTGYLANQYGRRNLLLLSISVMIVIIVVIILFNSQYMTYINRTLFGFFSVQIFSVFIVIAELFPKQYRGRGQAGLAICQVFAIVGTCLLLMKTNIEWKTFFILDGALYFVLLIGCYFYLDESPKFLVNMGYCEESIEKLNQIGRRNDENYQPLNDDEKKTLRTYANFIKESMLQSQERNIWDLLQSSGKTAQFLGLVWVIAFIIKFCVSGTVFMLNFLLKSDTNNPIVEEAGQILLFEIFGAIPGILMSFLLVDSNILPKQFFIAIGIFLSFINFILIFIFQEPFLVVGFTIQFMLVIYLQFFIIPLCNQSLSTQDRSVGLLSQQAIGALGSSITFAISNIIMQQGIFFPFLLYASLMIVAFLAAGFLPIIDGDRRVVMEDIAKSDEK